MYKITLEFYSNFRGLQILYSKWNYIYSVLSYSVDFKAPRSFEIHWVRQYMVKFMDLEGIVNTTVYETKPIFTGLRCGK